MANKDMSDFDFINEEEDEHEIATSGNPVGELTAEVIAEARQLAESPKGLDINKFFMKYHLVGVNLDNLLHGKLNKDGCLL